MPDLAREHSPNTNPAALGACPVGIVRLALTAFRSYSALRLDLEADKPMIVLTGQNGAGKTNILEAISFLAPGRGLRRASLEAVRQQSQGGAPVRWAVSADVQVDHDLQKVGTGEDPSGGQRRVVRLNGENQSQSEALGEAWSIVWLTPQMDRIFLEGPSARRRFLDRLVLSLFPHHGLQVSAYERAMRERNKLLSDGPFDAAWCAALEARMAEHGAAVAHARADYAAQLAGQFGAAAEGAFPTPALALEGDGEGLALDGQKPGDIEAALKSRWAEERTKDRALGRTTAGPHRTDLLVTMARTGMAAEQCSTGEQKALLVSIILANARLVAALSGKRPLLLLDEVAAHLDSGRRAALFKELEAIGSQVWLTGTDQSIFEGLSAAQYFKVAEGRVDRAA